MVVVVLMVGMLMVCRWWWCLWCWCVDGGVGLVLVVVVY